MNKKEPIEFPSKWPEGYGKIFYNMPQWKRKEITIELEKNSITKERE